MLTLTFVFIKRSRPQVPVCRAAQGAHCSTRFTHSVPLTHGNLSRAHGLRYPSPEQLKGRIIVKHKKLMDDSGEVSVTQYNSKDEDISDALKNGYLRLEDKHNGSWTKHYFVLTKTQISYVNDLIHFVATRNFVC